ncbi:hypothetical protein STENM223S_08761 [Streptomyces tendae]
MHGHGYAPPPPPRRPRTAVLVLLRVFFVALPLLSIGFLAWISPLYAAITSRRPRDWWAFAATAVVLVVSFCFLATDDTDDFSSPAGTTGMIILLLNACACAGYFLYADIRHHQRQLPACGNDAHPGAAAVVGDQRITVAQLENRVDEVREAQRAAVPDDTQYEQVVAQTGALTRDTLHGMVLDRVLHRAARDAGVTVSRREVEGMRGGLEEQAGGPGSWRRPGSSSTA